MSTVLNEESKDQIAAAFLNICEVVNNEMIEHLPKCLEYSGQKGSEWCRNLIENTLADSEIMNAINANNFETLWQDDYFVDHVLPMAIHFELNIKMGVDSYSHLSSMRESFQLIKSICPEHLKNRIPDYATE